MVNDISINVEHVLGPPSAKAAKTNASLIKLQSQVPEWFEVGAEKYRQMRENGETALPGLTRLPEARNVAFASREPGRSINCRLLIPQGQMKGNQPGVYLDIHGGGWVTMSETSQDIYLRNLANASGLAVLSVGYRLAPEHPYPAANEDCFDVAEYLVDNAVKDYGGPLCFVGGGSAGGHLSACVILHLLQVRPDFRLRGTLLNYGVFNLSTPLATRRSWNVPLALPAATLAAYVEAFVPHLNAEQRADPAVSPIYAPIFHIDAESQEGRGTPGLPPAFFVCGTFDPLLDDTILMAARWQMAGAETESKLYRGMPHCFNLFPDEQYPGSADCFERQIRFIKKHL